MTLAPSRLDALFVWLRRAHGIGAAKEPFFAKQIPPDGRPVSRFRSAMRDEVREIATVSQSPEEAVYEVFVVGSTDDVVDLVYEVSERVAGFEDLVLVISRGRAMTFVAGF